MARRPRALRLAAYLQHILDAVERIRTYTAELAEHDLLQLPIVQDAVIRNLEVIGEACRNIIRHHADFAAAHQDVPWHAPYEMRNALSHGYFSIVSFKRGQWCKAIGPRSRRKYSCCYRALITPAR